MKIEIEKSQLNGWTAVFLHVVIFLVSVWLIYSGFELVNSHLLVTNGYVFAAGIILFLLCIFMGFGYFTLEPNEAAILLLFGEYIGTEKTFGFRWANPLYKKEKISLRARNFDSQKLKVNDKKGNPIEISAVIVWKVEDTAEAQFEVENFIDYVHMQSESAIRHLAMAYSYDDTEGEKISLRSSIDEVSEHLLKEIEQRVSGAGVNILDARINHLAYAPEIAQAMLQRQQAEAIIAARTKIVDGAVGMVEMALERLKDEGVVDLDEEHKAALVGNLLLVLCSDKDAQPIVNAGNLY